MYININITAFYINIILSARMFILLYAFILLLFYFLHNNPFHYYHISLLIFFTICHVHITLYVT